MYFFICVNCNSRVPLCTILSGFFVYIWIYVLSATEEEYMFQYKIGCYSIAISCIISQISQCFTLVAQSYCFVKLRVSMVINFFFVNTKIILTF